MKNCGKYAIVAENQHGRAACTAEIIIEGSTTIREIVESSSSSTGPLTTKTLVSEELTSNKNTDENVFTSSTESKTITKTKSMRSSSTESSSKNVNVENLHAISAQQQQSSIIPLTVRDMSSRESQTSSATREAGIQINTDVKDKSSQIEVIRVKDESSQWMLPEMAEFERFTRMFNQTGAAPFISTQETHFSSSNVDEMNTSRSSYSYIQQSIAYSNNLTTQNTDYSTTLVKDVNRSYIEPIEVIINRNDSFNRYAGAASNLSSSTYVKEIEDFHHRPLNKFEPVNLIFQKPANRSGSLPPAVSRHTYRSSAAARSDFEQTDTEEESYYYYTDRSAAYDKENYMQSYLGDADSKVTYYKTIEKRSSRPSFRPVELILDASTFSDSGKRYRDKSCPVTMRKRVRVPMSHKNLITSSFVYDSSSNQHDYDYEYDQDYSVSDFISDREERESRYKYAGYKSYEERIEERQRIKPEPKYPTMEMTIDLKTPPTIDVPLTNITVTENHSARLECYITGKNSRSFKLPCL